MLKFLECFTIVSFGSFFWLKSKWSSLALDAGLLCPNVHLVLVVTFGFWVVELLPLPMTVRADMGVCPMVAFMQAR